MKLVIVESPTKARTLSRYLGEGFVVASSMGHVRDLPPKRLGVAVEADFAPEYVVLPEKKKVVRELKAKAKAVETVYLATDPDREGEAIAYHLSVLLGKGREYKRVTFHEITKNAILEAMKKPGELDMNLVEAQQARRVLDRLVGYKLSPLLWKKVRRGLSAGRVQSVAVRLVVEREKEREAFKSEEFWEVRAKCRKKSGEEKMLGLSLVRKGGKRIRIGSEAEVKEIVRELEGARYVVLRVTKKFAKSASPAPFTTSVLQQTAARVLGFSAKRTMKLAQDLYERGLITYHRTDSVNLASSAVEELRKFIAKKWGKEYLPPVPKKYKTKAKVAQEAHEAIRPTRVVMEEVGEGLTSSHQRLYTLIRVRALQSQMKEAEFENTTVVVGAGDYELEAKGKVMLFAGWQIANEKLKVKNEKLGGVGELPVVEEGEELLLVKVESEQKFTQPPARYTEAMLIKELEKRGIGRPSTYATIVSTIQERMYVVKEEKKFVPTLVGKAVTEFLMKYFPKIMDYEFTAKMEEELDAIARGERGWVEVLQVFWEPFYKRLVVVEKEAERVQIPVEGTGKKCPKCGEGEVVIRVGRFGKFLSCSRFPECDYKDQYIEYAKGVVCPQCGGRVVGRRSRKGKRFYGCEHYPKCKWMAWRLSEAKKVISLPASAGLKALRAGDQ